MGRTARRVDQQRPAPTPAAAPRAVQRRLYVPVPSKLALAQAVALGWLGVSVWLSLPWLGDLAGVVGPLPAVLVVAYLPGIDLLIPALDVAYSLVWLPGLLLAATGRFWIVGPYTVAVLPLTLLVNAILYRYQRRRVVNLLGLRVRRNLLGFVALVLTYQMLMSPVSVAGYVQELLGLRRRWK